MANRWRVFLTPIQLSPTFVEDLTLAALTLHNFLRSNTVSKQIYSPKGLADEEDISTGEVVPGSWRASELQMNPLPVPNSGHNASRLAKDNFTKISFIKTLPIVSSFLPFDFV